MSRKTTRREFLRVPEVKDAKKTPRGEKALDKTSEASLSESPTLIMHVSRRAMASEFEVRFPVGCHEKDAELALETMELLESVEEQISFYRPSSEISRINLLAAEGPIAVEPELFRLFCLARDIWQQTDGALDITSTALWQAWGFARRTGTVASEEQIAHALSRVGFQYVQLDAEHSTIRFTRQGLQLNLGSMGKGYALDQCTAKLLQGGMEHFLLHAGQSSILAHGSDSGLITTSQDTTPAFWTIGIPHPRRANQRIGEIKLRNRAIGTSSSQFQSFQQQGKRFGHIIDPRTGRPAEGVISATVVAPTAVLADALSTAFFVLGLEKTQAYCREHTEIGAILLTPSTRGKDYEIHIVGLNDCDFLIL
ncbi:MAG TPA: FAD:protein FMN transferase [Thermoguttaceae bacterium]